MTEKQLQDAVLRLAQMYAWRYYHTFDSRRSSPGFPDLVLVRPPRLLFVELKTEDGQIGPMQELWLTDLREVPGANVEVYVWRPKDLDGIPSILKR